MTVSVVICSYNSDRWHDLAAAVRSCADQTRPPDQVVVVIDHNEPLLHRAVLEFEGAVVLANRFSRGLSGARNTGIACSTGDVVAFLDDDAYADPQWLANLVGPMADPSVAGVGGWVLPHWETARPEWFPEAFYWVLGCSYVGLPTTDGHLRNPIGANMAIRRRVFRSVGGFASGLGRIGKVPLGCEETELCIRYTGRFPDQEFVLARRRHRPSPRAGLAAHLALLLDEVLGGGDLQGCRVLIGGTGLGPRRRAPLPGTVAAQGVHAECAIVASPPSFCIGTGRPDGDGHRVRRRWAALGRMALRVSPIDTRKDDLGLRDLDHLLQPFEAVDVASEADTRASVLR